MAQVKGKFISLAGSLMGLYQDHLNEANNVLKAAVGKNHDELEPEGWYDTRLFDAFIRAYSAASVTGDKAIVTLGRRVYPTIQKTVGLPPHLKTPLDAILFEAEGFKLNHQGSDVRNRVFVKKENKHVVVRAPAPGYSQRLYEGVYLGILEMYGVKSGNVAMTKGAPDFEYAIKW